MILEQIVVLISKLLVIKIYFVQVLLLVIKVLLQLKLTISSRIKILINIYKRILCKNVSGPWGLVQIFNIDPTGMVLVMAALMVLVAS